MYTQLISSLLIIVHIELNFVQFSDKKHPKDKIYYIHIPRVYYSINR